MTKVGDREIHPAAEVLPRQAGGAFEAFVENIREHGQLDEAEVLTDGRIIDGYDRARACHELGIPLRTKTVDVADPEEYVWSKIGHRKHLDPGVLAAARVKLLDMKAERAARPRGRAAAKIPTSERLPPLHETVARDCGISKSVAADALSLAESPDELDRVIRGEVSLNVAAKALRENRSTATPKFRRTRIEQAYPLLDELDLPGGHWVDPCAGDGALIRLVHQVRLALGEPPPSHWTAIEIEDQHDALEMVAADLGISIEIHSPVDLLAFDGDVTSADVVITNWPWFGIVPLVEQCFRLAPGAWVIGLCDLMEFVDRGNADWFREHCPDLMHCPGRQRFDDAKAGYRGQVSWFVWEPGRRMSRDGRHEFLSAYEDNEC